MPVVKEELVLPEGFSVDPEDSYIRIARVEKTSLTSRDLLVQFIDGSRVEGQWTEEQVTVTTVIGSPDQSTTYVPSAVVYGRGDLCAVMILKNQEMYAVSTLDDYNNINRENYPVLKGWALFDVLNGMNIDGAEDGEDSFITFWNPNTHVVTKITGDPEKNKVMERLLLYFTREKTCSLPITTCQGGWSFDVARSGPDINPETKINGRVHKGYHVNGLPYVEDTLFSNSNTLEATHIAYSNTLIDQIEEKPHPLTGDLINRFFKHAKVVWFPGDDDPSHVVLMGTFPTWWAAQYIMILEVPVYCLAGRKFLEREVINEGEVNEEKNIVQSWQMWGDSVRVLRVIPRSYIDWIAHASDVTFSERLHKSISVFTPRPQGNSLTFGILDGYGWGQDGTVYTLNKLRRITGTIERALINETLEPYQNGSRYKYQITNTDPIAAGHVDIFVPVLFEYEWNSGDEWERQTVTDTLKEFPAYTDGTNTMHRTVDLNYHVDGHYDPYLMTGGTATWTDGAAGTDGVQDITNDCSHSTFRNDILRWTDTFYFRKTTADGFWGGSTTYVTFYADIEYDLFVIEKIVTVVDKSSCMNGPGYTCTGTQIHYGIVMFLGVEYIIWEYVIDLLIMPTLWNFWPWIMDGGEPTYPDDTPYSVYQPYDCGYWFEPHFDMSLGTLKTGYSSCGLGYPGPLFSPESMPQNQILDTSDYSKSDDLLRVSIDMAEDSFSVKFECYMQDATMKVLSYPNTGDTLFRFNGGLPHFNNPSPTVIIDLMDNTVEEE